MSSFPQFASSISLYKIKKLEDMVHETRAGLRIHPLGYAAGKVFYQASAIRPLFQEILTRLPYITECGQPVIAVTFGKILNLSSSLKTSIEAADKVFPKSIKNSDLFQKAFDLLSQIQQYIPYLSNSSAPTMVKHLETITKNITQAVELYDKIISNTVKYDKVIQEKIKPLQSSQIPLSSHISAAVVHYELLFIELSFIGSLDKVKNSEEISHVIMNLLKTVRDFSETLFKMS